MGASEEWASLPDSCCIPAAGFALLSLAQRGATVKYMGSSRLGTVVPVSYGDWEGECLRSSVVSDATRSPPAGENMYNFVLPLSKRELLATLSDTATAVQD